MSAKKKGRDPANRSLRDAVRVFKRHGGVLRTVDVRGAGQSGHVNGLRENPKAICSRSR